jgi:hypothetical protein
MCGGIAPMTGLKRLVLQAPNTATQRKLREQKGNSYFFKTFWRTCSMTDPRSLESIKQVQPKVKQFQNSK